MVNRTRYLVVSEKVWEGALDRGMMPTNLIAYDDNELAGSDATAGADREAYVVLKVSEVSIHQKKLVVESLEKPPVKQPVYWDTERALWEEAVAKFHVRTYKETK